MATEKRLIDVTEPLKLFRGWLKQLELPEDAGDKRGVESCIDILEDEPTVDAVEVVRCKDCKWYNIAPFDNVPYCSHESGYCGENMGGLFFCACGERKHND